MKKYKFNYKRLNENLHTTYGKNEAWVIKKIAISKPLYDQLESPIGIECLDEPFLEDNYIHFTWATKVAGRRKWRIDAGGGKINPAMLISVFDAKLEDLLNEEIQDKLPETK
jgi:hypothetical protein